MTVVVEKQGRDQLPAHLLDEIAGMAPQTGYNAYRLRSLVALAAGGLLGTARHPYDSMDWIAHNKLWADSVNELQQLIAPTPSGLGSNRLGDAVVARLRAVAEAEGYVTNGPADAA